MISRYRLLAERIRTELRTLGQVVDRTQGALDRAAQREQDQAYFLAAAALDLHGFYVGVERLFELIAKDVDESLPDGPHWHNDLLAQMSLAVNQLRPAVITSETRSALLEFMGFRHVVRNVYTFNLQAHRVTELAQALPTTFDLIRRDLLAFTRFLEKLSKADEA